MARITDRQPPPDSGHTLQSSLRASIVEHLFVGELMALLWSRGIREIELLRAEVDCAGQKPSQLLEDEFHIVHIDHHAVMIDPKTSFQAHTRLETRSTLQAHAPLEEAGEAMREPCCLT